jgi:hypothetical protein
MAVSVIPLDCDINCTSASKHGTEQTPKWSDDELKSFWSSLLNLELVSKYHEDVELQGIQLLLETTFIIFKSKCYILFTAGLVNNPFQVHFSLIMVGSNQCIAILHYTNAPYI